jgi:large conductance mechanosensitive channel
MRNRGMMIRDSKPSFIQGNLIIIAVGLVVALAFSTLVTAFTNDVITPLINSLAGSRLNPRTWLEVNGQFINIGAFISAVIYFVIFMAVVYYALVVPYRTYMARGGTTVFGAPEPPPPPRPAPSV